MAPSTRLMNLIHLPNWDFDHVTSSPRYPQSNGLVEKTVQTIKRILKKAQSSGKNPYISVLEYRTTPSSCGYSPEQLLMSRRLRSVLPFLQSQLIPNTPDVVKINNHLKCNHTLQKKCYDTGTKQLKPLNHNEIVRIQDHIN